MSRFQFVADNSTTYPVKRLCHLVEIQRTSNYAWRAGGPGRARRAAADAGPSARIRVIHTADNTVPAATVTAELNDGAAAPQRVNHRAGPTMIPLLISGGRLRWESRSSSTSKGKQRGCRAIPANLPA